MARAFAQIAFTPSVLAAQAAHGSAEAYEQFLAPATDRGDRLTEFEASFIAARDGFYQATVSEAGWPYVQFRGGPKGFVKVLDDHTISFADFRGNRQYLSVGNLMANNRISLILMDYPNQRRLKIWGRAKFIEIADDPELLADLQIDGYRARPERAVIVSVEAFDWNCPQHIPQHLTIEEFDACLAPLREEIDRLTSENDVLTRSLQTLRSKCKS